MELKKILCAVDLKDSVNPAVEYAKMAMLQTAKCGKFSSDRTIEEYAKEIWHLEKVTL